MESSKSFVALPVGKKRWIILTGLVCGLMIISTLWIYYLTTRKPLADALPGAPLVDTLQPHYLFSIYGVDKPLGVASDASGTRADVTESGGKQQIKVFDRDGEFLSTLASDGESLVGRTPIYVAVSPADEIYVSDRQQRALLVYSQAGEQVRTVTQPSGIDGWTPLGMSFAGDTLLVTDVTERNHRVVVADSDGNVRLAFGAEGKDPGQFWFPNGIEADKEGRIYVSDGNNGRLQVFDAQGQLLYKIGGLNLPRGMATDDQGRLYVADAVGQRILVYNLNTQPIELLYEFGDLGLGDGEFNYPNDIAVDSSGRIYVADRENNRVQVWSY